MSKKKGTPGGNPNPIRTPRNDKDPYPDVPLTKKLQIWMYAPVVERLNQMTQKERTIWLRGAIARAAIEELGVKIE